MKKMKKMKNHPIKTNMEPFSEKTDVSFAQKGCKIFTDLKQFYHSLPKGRLSLKNHSNLHKKAKNLSEQYFVWNKELFLQHNDFNFTFTCYIDAISNMHSFFEEIGGFPTKYH